MWQRCAQQLFFLRNSLVECLVVEVADTHAGFLVVELVHTHVLFLDLDSSVVERVETMLARCYRNHHFGRDDLPVDAPCALGRDSKNFAHNKTF